MTYIARHMLDAVSEKREDFTCSNRMLLERDKIFSPEKWSVVVSSPRFPLFSFQQNSVDDILPVAFLWSGGKLPSGTQC